MMRLIVTIFLVTSLTAASTRAQSPPKEVVFLTNYVFLGRHAPFFVGLEKGFYREAGFDIEIQPSTGSGSVIAALEGGQADFGIAEVAPVVQAVAKGARVKAFGVYMDESTSGLASLTPYPSPASIAGRPIAASVTDSARVILPIIYHLEGLDPASLTWQAADPSVYFPLLLQGRVELVTASIDSDVPTLRRATEPRGQTVHFASFAEWGYDVFGYFLIGRTDKIASRPEDARAFAAATARAVRYSVDHPDEAVKILVKHNRTLDRALMRTQWQQSIAAIETPYVKENGYGQATRERLERSIELVIQAFELDTTLTPEDVFASGLVAP